MVPLTLASAQFLMTLHSSGDERIDRHRRGDFGTTVTGIQTAITLYVLVMASLMITGGQVSQIRVRKGAFVVGCVIYGSGSLTTALGS